MTAGVTAGVGRDGVSYVTMHGPCAIRVRDSHPQDRARYAVEYKMAGVWYPAGYYITHEGAKSAADDLLEMWKDGELPWITKGG
jgi:hypothetical protein